MKDMNSIPSLIEEYLKREDVVLAQRENYRTYQSTGKELSLKVRKLRIFLKKANIHRGDKIIILGINSINWISVYFACIMSGITAVPLDVLTDKTLLKKINQKIEAKALFADKALKLEGLKTYSLNDLDEYIKNIKLIHLPHVRIRLHDIIEIMYTSGSTGEPKGVMLTHKNLLSGINFAIGLVPIKIKLKMLNLLPLSHIFAQVYGLFFIMYFRHKIFYIDTLQPSKITSFIKNKKINGIILVPGMLESLKKYLEGKSILANLGLQFRLIGIGGAPLDIELEKWWRKHCINVVQGYGMTETSSVISSNSLLNPKAGSVGKISKGIGVKLAEDNEILVKGKNVTPGYYKDSEKTHEAFEDEWFKTGDVGEIIGNYLYIKERKKDVIITPSGLKVYPTDIEKILNKIEGVKESCVLEKDKKIHAVLMVDKKANPAQIIKKVNSVLLAHQKISSFSTWTEDTFPKTPTAKIKKYLVLEQITKQNVKPKRRPCKYKDKLYTIINTILKPNRKISSRDKLLDLGMDSLRRVELITGLESAFGVEIEETALNQYTKVADLKQLTQLTAEHYAHRIKFRSWPLNPISRFVRGLGQHLIGFPFIRIFTKTEFYGLEMVSAVKGPTIFASNHQSAWDGGLIIKNLTMKIAIPSHARVVFGLGVPGILGILAKLRGLLATLFFNTYPFGESIGANRGLEFTGEMIDRGYSILIFPEGERSRDGNIHEFKQGIGYLALNMGIPIIPVRVEDLYYVLPWNKIIPRFGKSTIKFGKPIMPDEFKDLSYVQATKLIEKRVREL